MTEKLSNFIYALSNFIQAKADQNRDLEQWESSCRGDIVGDAAAGLEAAFIEAVESLMNPAQTHVSGGNAGWRELTPDRVQQLSERPEISFPKLDDRGKPA